MAATTTKFSTGTTRTSGIAAASVAAGTNLIGSLIDPENAIFADVELVVTEGATPPTAGAALKLAILTAWDGTNAESGTGDGANGANDIDPAGATIEGAYIARGVAGTWRRTLKNVQLCGKSFKPLLVSELSQAVTVTVNISTHSYATA